MEKSGLLFILLLLGESWIRLVKKVESCVLLLVKVASVSSF